MFNGDRSIGYCVETVIKSNVNRMEYAKESVKLHERLMECGLFDVYASFNEFRLKNHYQAAAWADGNLKLMGKTVRSHFLFQHAKNGASDEGNFVYRYEARSKDTAGSRKGILAYVQLHGEEYCTKYNVKYHHYGSSYNTTKACFPDIREIFCYKLLELIEVGPAVQFILPSDLTGSKHQRI
jgi:hypothetical protein